MISITEHAPYSVWQGQHEETFFKSTSPCFEWDGVGLGARSCAWKVLRGSIQVPASEKTISDRRKTRQKSNLSNLSNFSTSSRFFFCFPEILVYHHGARRPRWVLFGRFSSFFDSRGSCKQFASPQAQKLSEDLDPTKSGMAGDPKRNIAREIEMFPHLIVLGVINGWKF